MTRVREWYEDHENLADLWRWLDDRCEAPTDNVGRFLDEPWHWESAWNELQAQRAQEALPA